MATLIIPRDDEPWPTLGKGIVEWIEANLVYGPGDMVGQPYKVEREFKGLIYSAYEIVPRKLKGEGRRRFNRVGWNIRKGTAKTEKAAIIAACELHPDAPVRFDGWDASGQPVGRGVVDPYVAMVAFTLEQTEELGFNVLRTILQESALEEDFDIGLERIVVLNDRGRAAGKAVPLTGAPGARDGARTTHNSFDETHRMTTPRLINAHTTMLQNTFKRQMADAWSLETTTMYDPTETSVAKKTHEYAQEVDEGRMTDSRLFYFYRYAPDEMPTSTIDEVTEALVEASGPTVAWSGDIDGLAKHWFEPGTDRQYYQRVWLNRKVAGGGKAFNSVKWADNTDAAHVVPDKAKISIGFDGSKNRDGTALVCTELASGFQWLAGYWQAPPGTVDDEWEVPTNEVEQVLEELFDKYKVTRMYGDPYYWKTEMKGWAGRWGDTKVVEWDTTLLKRTGTACKSYADAINANLVTHDGGTTLAEHIGNAVRQDTNLRADDQEQSAIWVISKERRGGPLKIDAAMAAVLSWQAANDAIAKGALKGASGLHSFN